MGYQPIKCRSGHGRGGEAERDGACEPNAKWNDFLVYDDLRWVCRRSPPHPTRCPFVSVLQDTIAAGTRARPCPRQPSAALLEEEEDAGMIGEEVATASAGAGDGEGAFGRAAVWQRAAARELLSIFHIPEGE